MTTVLTSGLGVLLILLARDKLTVVEARLTRVQAALNHSSQQVLMAADDGNGNGLALIR